MLRKTILTPFTLFIVSCKKKINLSLVIVLIQERNTSETKVLNGTFGQICIVTTDFKNYAP